MQLVVVVLSLWQCDGIKKKNPEISVIFILAVDSYVLLHVKKNTCLELF